MLMYLLATPSLLVLLLLIRLSKNTKRYLDLSKLDSDSLVQVFYLSLDLLP